MDDARRKKAAFAWDPQRSGLFVLGLGGAVRLYAWDDRAKDAVAMGSRDNVGPLAGLAWSPHTKEPTLAAAVTGGAVDIISFRRPLFPRPGEMTASESFTLHPPRQARQTTALAFSRPEYGYRHLLAQGFTKTRSDASVLVWDITRIGALASGGLGVYDQDGVAVDGGAGAQDRPKPVNQLIPSETIHDLAWLSPSLLAVATQRQPIRLYDVRAPSSAGTAQPVLQFGSHGSGLMTGHAGGASGGSSNGGSQGPAGGKVISLKVAADPFSAVRLASVDETPLAAPLAPAASAPAYYSPSLRGEPRTAPASAAFSAGGVVRVWDQRAPRAEVFALGAAGEGGLRSAAMSCEWDAETYGRLAVLEHAGGISVWDTYEPSVEAAGDESRALTLVGEPYRVPPPAPPAAYSSFVFPPRPQDEAKLPAGPNAAPRIVAFSAKAGGELLWPKFHQRQILAFASDNSLTVGPRLSLVPPIADPTRRASVPSKGRHSKQPSVSSAQDSSEDEDATPFGHTVPLPPAPQPFASASAKHQQLLLENAPVNGGVAAAPASEPQRFKASNVLAADAAVVLKSRAQLGYGVDPSTNADIADKLGDESLSFFWKWLQSWKSAFPADHYSRYQFHLRGVQQILDGLESASFNPTLLQARSRSPHTAGGRSASSSRERAPMSIADRRKQHSRTRADLRGPSPSASDRTAAGAGRADPADYKSACRKWIEGRAGEGATVSVSVATVSVSVAGGTKLAEERVCALAVLDWALSNAELEARIQSLERAGDYEKAAFCGLFTGSVDRSLEVLEASGDERYLTMVLLIRSRLDNSPRDSYALASSRLISKLDSVEVRAVCRFGLTGDWEEVLNEAGGSVIDTLGLALKWAPDGVLRQYLRSSRNNAVASGDLMGLALTGLADSQEATTLLQAFIDKTGDIQTAALVAAQFWPSKKVKARYERWIETYETLLQGWDLCAARAKIEQARGRLAREQNVSFRPPKEIIVRCAFCNKNVADLRATASLSGIRGSSATVCPGCLNGLPNCVICRLSISRAPGDILGEASGFDADADLRPIYCLKCRHGGHRSPCLREWFSSENADDADDAGDEGQTCAEVGCDCRCAE